MKYCTGCNQFKDVSEYGHDKDKKDGLAWRCKKCSNLAARERYRKDRPHRNYLKSRESRTAAYKRYIKKYPERRKARMDCNNAVISGKLKVPSKCEYCGKRKKLQAHHHNGYSPEHALDVVFICIECHYKCHLEEREHNIELLQGKKRSKV